METTKKQATEAKEALDRSQKLYDESKSKKRDYVLEHALAIHMLDAVADTVRDIKAKGDEGVLPPKIQEPFVRDLLAKGTCICGGDISHGNPSRGRIMKHLNQARYSPDKRHMYRGSNSSWNRCSGLME